jgi:hypothetical protein
MATPQHRLLPVLQFGLHPLDDFRTLGGNVRFFCQVRWQIMKVAKTPGIG